MIGNIWIKWIAGVLSGVLLFTSIVIPYENVFAQNIIVRDLHEHQGEEILFSEREIQEMEEFVKYIEKNEEEFIKLFQEVINETKSEFIDPSIADELMINTNGLILGNQYIMQKPRAGNEYTIQGKLTMSAKAAAKAIRAVMNKIGKKAWNKMVKKMEQSTGISLPWFHWKTINGILDWLAGFKGTVEDALTQFLVKKAKFSKKTARFVARTFIFLVL